MKLVTSYGARYYGSQKGDRSDRVEGVTALLYGVGCACWFVGSGRYFPVQIPADPRYYLLMAVGSGLIMLVNVLEFTNVMGKYVKDRRSAVPIGQTRADGVVAVLAMVGALGVCLASVAAVLDPEMAVGKTRMFYSSSFFFLAAAVLNGILHTSYVEEELDLEADRVMSLSNAMLTLHTVACSFLASGALIQATVVAAECQRAFFVGSYFLFIAGSLLFSASFLSYLRYRALRWIGEDDDFDEDDEEAQPLPPPPKSSKSGASSSSTTRKKKTRPSTSDEPHSSWTWTPWSLLGRMGGSASHTNDEEHIKPTKKSKSKDTKLRRKK
mmetsp:Transcript_16290/g.33064  ORF Transcript_16290/g.33064 Transcript_16290/m.33064 type:complete len:326 (-) Transcript_16290:17-994(-)